jgi:hypothetical protein
LALDDFAVITTFTIDAARQGQLSALRIIFPPRRQERKENYFLTYPNLAAFAPLREIF